MNFLSVTGEALDFAAAHEVAPKSVTVVVENADLDGAVFGAWHSFKSVLLSAWRKVFKGVEKTLRSHFNRHLSKAQNIGMVKIVSRVVIKRLRQEGFTVIEVAPSWRHNATAKPKKRGGLHTNNPANLIKPTKLKAPQFKALTGYTGSSNEHGRDAATLIYAQTTNRLLMWVQACVAGDRTLKPAEKKAYFERHGIKIR